MDTIQEPTSCTVGAAPLFRQMADEIGLVALINGMVRWDTRQSDVSPGERILVMSLDVLAGKTPLYRLSERLTTTDLEILVGAGRRPEDFTDDSLGRALDKLACAEPARVFSTITAAAYAHESLTLGTGHGDSTSRSVYGGFRHAADGVHPAYGHSKDHRADLKQILMTLFVNREGVPLFGTVASGNQSDKTLNGAMIDRLTAALDPTQLQHLIYVADSVSVLVTSANLTRLADGAIRFISRCPDTFGATGAAKTAAWAADGWEAIGAVAQRDHEAEHRASEQSGVIGDHCYRLVVYRFTVPAQRHARAVDQDIEQQRRVLDQAANSVRAQASVCEAEARQALAHWLATPPQAWHHVSGDVRAETRYARPGRPRTTPIDGDVITTWRVAITVGAVDAARRQQALERRSTFVLITTVPQDELSAADLLTEYKGQIHVERHFYFLKDPLFVDRFTSRSRSVWKPWDMFSSWPVSSAAWSNGASAPPRSPSPRRLAGY